MRSFQKRLPEFESRGIRIAVISADSPEAIKEQARKMELTFSCLADPNAEVIARYGVLHKSGGPHGTDIARPSEFLINSSGKVCWEYFTRSTVVRARPEQVLEAASARLK